jgi:hypothetical protein
LECFGFSFTGGGNESNLVFPGFLLVCLYELLECLGDNIAEQAGIGRDDRHHRLNHLLWIMPFALLPKKGKIVLDIRSLDEVPAVRLGFWMRSGAGGRPELTESEKELSKKKNMELPAWSVSSSNREADGDVNEPDPGDRSQARQE